MLGFRTLGYSINEKADALVKHAANNGDTKCVRAISHMNFTGIIKNAVR